MKKYFFFLLAFTLILGACKDDEDIITPPENLLNYDGDNFSAPALDADKYEAAARFTSFELGNVSNRRLVGVEVYFVSVPVQPEIRIYGKGTDNTPGDLLYSANITAVATTDSWNAHTLTTPLDISGQEELWIAVKMEHPETFGSVGCDEGPADDNGDLMFVNSQNTWTNLRNFTNGETSINWNIRGVLSEE